MGRLLRERVALGVDDGVARLDLARDDGRHALDLETGRALREAAETVAHDVVDGAARVVVVGAEGAVFSVGGDLRSFAGADDRGAEAGAVADEIHAALAILWSLPVPVVSVVPGTAAGGGLGLALCGDVVLAASEARLVAAYTASGLSPDCGLTWILPRRLSWVRAMDLVLTNRVLTGDEAAAWGLVSRAVPADRLAAEVDAVVTALRDGPAGALAATKRLLAEGLGRDAVEQMDLESASIARQITSPEGTEGVDAFLAKRPPRYR